MPGQAIVLIRDKQWQVTLATTAWEQASGLGGIPPIPPGTGMLFDLGCDQIITVSTLPMLFPLDIAFVSDSLMVVDIGRDVPPGLLASSSVPARFFLEVSSGELAGVDTGDRVELELIPAGVSQDAGWTSQFFSFMTFTVMGIFVAVIARMFVNAALEKPEEKPALYGPRGEKRLLPQTSAAPRQRWYEKGMEAGKTDGWMTVEETLPQTLQAHRGSIKDASDLVWIDIELWEGTDHFTVLYGSKIWQDAKRDIDSYEDLKAEFWEGYLAGRKAIGRDVYHMASELLKVERAGFLPKTAKPARASRYDVSVEAWQERDRLGIWITDDHTGRIIAEWWDDEAREMFEQGFFKPGVPRLSRERPGRDFVDSVLDYAEGVGLLARASSPGTTPSYLPQTSTATKLNGLQIVRAYKQVSAHGEDKICVQLQAWAIFPRGKRPHFLSMYRTGDKYVISPLYAHVQHQLEVSVSKVDAWIRSLPVRHFEPMAVDPQYREEAERLAKGVDTPMDIVQLPRETSGTGLDHKVIPVERPKRTTSELEYFADSPEFLTQTIDATGYREKIDKAFQEAIARAKGLR